MESGEYTILMVIFVACFFWFCWQKIKPPKEPEDEPEPDMIDNLPEFDALRMMQEVRALHNKMNELEKLDKLIIDLRLCRPSEAVRAFHLEWMSTSGAENKLDLMANGENALTTQLLLTAEAHRAEMNREVIQRIYDLYTICCERDADNILHSPNIEFPDLRLRQ